MSFYFSTSITYAKENLSPLIKRIHTLANKVGLDSVTKVTILYGFTKIVPLLCCVRQSNSKN